MKGGSSRKQEFFLIDGSDCLLIISFRCLALSPSLCKTLVSTYHIHLPGSGRINISGLSEDNVARTAKAIDEVVRMSGEREI